MNWIEHLKLSHLRLMARLAETGQISLAAEMLGITQPSASRLLVEIGDLVGRPVHERSGRGIALTEAGRALARRAGRILLELDDTAAELADIASGGQGHVRLGAVTAPAMDLVLPSIRTFRVTDPGVTFEVSVSPSALLCQELRAGRLDLVVGRIATEADAEELEMEPISTEPISLIVRRGHPLDRGELIGLDELLGYDWVLPGGASPLTEAVRRSLGELGRQLPRQQLATASFLMTLVMIRQSNAIAPLAGAVVRAFTRAPQAQYAELPTILQLDAGPYGLLTRKGQGLTPAVARFAAMLRGRRSAAPAPGWDQASAGT